MMKARYILMPPLSRTMLNHALPLENAAVFKVFSSFWSQMGALGVPYELARVPWVGGDEAMTIGGSG